MNTPECCDKPRGFVGETCDYCGGTAADALKFLDTLNA